MRSHKGYCQLEWLVWMHGQFSDANAVPSCRRGGSDDVLHRMYLLLGRNDAVVQEEFPRLRSPLSSSQDYGGLYDGELNAIGFVVRLWFPVVDER